MVASLSPNQMIAAGTQATEGREWVVSPAAVALVAAPAAGPSVVSPSWPVACAAADWALVSVLAMAADLPTELFGDLDGKVGDRGVLDSARLRDVHLPFAGDPAGTGGEQYHPLGEPYGLADVVGDEEDREAARAGGVVVRGAPDAGQLVVQH